MVEPGAPPAPLARTVAALAREMSVPTPTLLLVHRPGAPPGWAEVNRRTRTIRMSTAAAERPDGTLYAVLAHEMAHLRRLRREIVAFLLLTAALAVFLTWVILTRAPLLGRGSWYLVVDLVLVPWFLAHQWLRRRNEIAADRTAAHHTGADGAAAFDGDSGWVDWPASTTLRRAMRPWRAHPWPPVRVQTFREHAWREHCGCPGR